MSDLPEERLRICPPFTYVGVDCFGPWDILSRRTRGGSACSKRWAIIFVCLSCRGIHIEIIEEMTTSSFVNALRRFISVRGKVKEFFSDRGSNFIGGVRELGLQAIFTEETEMKRFLNEQNAVWKFNTPYSSHHGGSWERLIGTIRRVLDSILFEARHKKLTHELLCTFMSEAMAIVNSRPLSSISSDHEAPFILSPNALITQKVGDSVEDFSSISLRDVYTSQWKFVQFLAEQFWRQWRREYLQSLQHRRKWHDIQENIREGDIVIIKDNELHRNQWPLGLIECVYPGKDNLVRKVKLRVIRDGKPHEYMRPITQIVFLCHGSSNT